MRTLAAFTLLSTFLCAQAATREADGTVVVSVPLLALNAKEMKDAPLQAQDFKVFEDGKEVKVTGLTAAPDEGITVGVLLDSSNSQNAQFQAVRSAVFHLVTTEVRDNKDKVEAGVFDTVTELQDVPGEKAEALKLLSTSRAGGGSAFYDAIFVLCRHGLNAASRASGVNVPMFVFSDGDDNQSHLDAREAIAEAQRSNVTVIAVDTGFRALPVQRTSYLGKIARETGGLFFEARDWDRKDPKVRDIFAQLRNRLYLTYLGTSERKPAHKIEIKVLRKNVKISAPSARFDPPESDPAAVK